MAIRVDLTGERFGKLVVLEYNPKSFRWRCKCDCGGERNVLSSNLRRGLAGSCGCLKPRKSKYIEKAGSDAVAVLRAPGWGVLVKTPTGLRALDSEFQDLIRLRGSQATIMDLSLNESKITT